jgi:hypothetical protein
MDHACITGTSTCAAHQANAEPRADRAVDALATDVMADDLGRSPAGGLHGDDALV